MVGVGLMEQLKLAADPSSYLPSDVIELTCTSYDTATRNVAGVVVKVSDFIRYMLS